MKVTWRGITTEYIYPTRTVTPAYAYLRVTIIRIVVKI